MVCWNRLWTPRQREVDREMNQALEELRKTLTTSQALAPDAMTVLLGGVELVSEVEARLAKDGHDIEVKLNGGSWRVLQPTEVFPVSRQRLELPVSKPRSANWLIDTGRTRDRIQIVRGELEGR